jgi:nicotinate-nucleotide adenylyltransferase
LRRDRASVSGRARNICFIEVRLKKIGIYGGTFDPIHHGHLILAREAREILDLGEVIFVLAAQSPHKTNLSPASAAARWAMLCAAIAHEDGFSASRLEIDRPPPSYSIDTVEQLRAERQDTEFFFLIGEDNLPQLPTWHRFGELNRLVQFVVLDRSGATVEERYPVVRRKIDISATTIRNRVASGQSIRYLVPEAVEQIIRRENLYQGANRSHRKS